MEVKKNGVTIAQFTYDGDGKRVKSVIGGETTYFVGSYYEQKGSQVTKYYFAGTSRIAMRKYTIPQNMTAEYLLSDHLGSTSITTDANGAKVSEMRYKPWGEVRYAWTASLTTTPAYRLADYTLRQAQGNAFTGQYSYMDDPSTIGVTEGFGLMFYNARWYDPYLNHFTQPDTIVPDPYNPQDWDRYAYARNNPLKYTDPSGHSVDCAIGEQNCSAGKLVPSWWRGTKKHLYIDGYGYFETGHIKRGWDTAEYMFKKAEELGKAGGEILMSDNDHGFTITYTLSPNLSEDELPGVLYGIYTDFEYAYEEFQGDLISPDRLSSFAPEDLPSDHVGFWAYVNGLDKDEIPQLLMDSLGEVSVRTGFGAVGLGFVKNHEFLPMIDKAVCVGRLCAIQQVNIPWPTWLQIDLVPSGPNTWQK